MLGTKTINTICSSFASPGIIPSSYREVHVYISAFWKCAHSGCLDATECTESTEIQNETEES